MVIFFGAFLRPFLHTKLGLGEVGWIAADLEVGALASLLVRLAFFRPNPEADLARMRGSQRVRARRLLALGVGVLAEDDQQRVRVLVERIRRQLVRLNETTLTCEEHRARVATSRLAASVEQYAHARDRLDHPVTEEEVAAAAGGGFTRARPGSRNGQYPPALPRR